MKKNMQELNLKNLETAVGGDNPTLVPNPFPALPNPFPFPVPFPEPIHPVVFDRVGTDTV